MTVLALSSSQRSSIQKTTSNAAGLPAESYIHEDWLKTERERIFASEWTAVGFVHNGTILDCDSNEFYNSININVYSASFNYISAYSMLFKYVYIKCDYMQ